MAPEPSIWANQQYRSYSYVDDAAVDGDGHADGEVRALARLDQAADGVRDFAAQAKAPNTLKAYRTDWAHFSEWCRTHQLEPLPAGPRTVALYLTDLARTHKVSTLYRRLSGISQAHQAAGLSAASLPTRGAQVRLVFQGNPPQSRRCAHPEERGDHRRGAGHGRDALAYLFKRRPRSGAAPRRLRRAFRRSELVALDTADVTFGAEGLIVQLRRSKTDQEGEGRKVGLPFGSQPLTCPVRALHAWLDAAAIFRAVDRHGNLGKDRLSDQSVALVVKRCARAAGLDGKRYAGHSLRSGLATSADMADVSERAIMAQTGHKSLPMVRRYIRDGSLFRRNTAAAVGL
jgi:site-specific recombinase XerD